MDGYIKGWNLFNFLISPQELESIIKKFHHVEYTIRVSENYVETDPQEYIQKYKKFYEKLTSNYKFVWNKDYKLFDLNIGLSNDLSKCTYGKKFLDENDQKYYKISDFKEPSVGLSIFILFLNKDKKLFSNYSYTQFPENAIGLQMQFPKDFYYYEKENNEVIIKEEINCNNMETFNEVYKTIVSEIKNISKNLIFTIGEKEYKTSIKVSKNITNEIKNIYFMSENNCIIK